MRRGMVMAFVAFSVLTGGVLALRGSVNEDQRRSPLQRLAWIEGSWVSDVQGEVTEEVWMAPRRGLMVGMNRNTPPKGAPGFEFLRIEEREGSLVYIAQPRGAKPTEFPMTSLTDETVTFENPMNDFPQRIVYERLGEDQLTARIEGGVNGKTIIINWTWDRVK